MEWIKVSERLPDSGWEEVLAYDGVGVMFSIFSGGRFLDAMSGSGEYDYDEISGVTHWAIPSPPDKE